MRGKNSGIVNTYSGERPKVFTINQNRCLRWIRIGVHDAPESVFMLGQNMQAGINQSVSNISYYRPEWQANGINNNGVNVSASNGILFAGKSLSGYLSREHSHKCDDFSVSQCDSLDELIENIEDALSLESNRALVIDLDIFCDLQPNEFLFSIIEVVTKIIDRSLSRELRVLLCNVGFIVDDRLLSAVPGFCRSIRKEVPHIQLGYVDMKTSIAREPHQWLRTIVDECFTSQFHTWVCYQQENRYVKHYSRVAINDSRTPRLTDGVCIITGGLGALGYLLAKHLLQTSNLTVALVCRRVPEGRQKERYEDLISLGGDARVRLLEADLANYEAVLSCFSGVLARHGSVRGIVHCAGVTHDSLIINKKKKDVAEIIASKVEALTNINQAMLVHNITSDYLVLFSSIASAVGNIGQCDYAFANAFLDAFAESSSGTAFRRTISINWPLWQTDGMQSDEGHIEQLFSQFGIEALSVDEGLSCFDNILNASESNICVVKGDPHKTHMLFEEAPQPLRKITAKSTSNKQLYYTALNNIKQAISLAIKTDIADIVDNVEFEVLGVDSISMVNITYDLEKRYGELPKTLFFEYKRVSNLATYLAEISADEADNASDVQVTPSIRQDNNYPKTHYADLSVKSMINIDADDIAVIGIAGEYPGADNLDEFWNVIKQGRDCISEIPYNRWDINSFISDEAVKGGKSYAKWGGFINDAFRFDPMFFGISPLEAERIDPQERRLLECCWTALENACCTREEIVARYDQNVGVFVGVMNNDFMLYNAPLFTKGDIPGVGSSLASAANRISYALDLSGPSLAVDTMCSSSLTSIHLACESLASGECKLALAGGANLLLHPIKYSLLSQRMFLSTDGRCRSFGDGGNGYVPGEGVGMVVLKPLADAVRDGDYIHGVIKASAIGHGGKTNGYTVPSPSAQRNVIQRAIAKSGINPDTIGYVEAHGTGTALGDPIEIEGLKAALGCNESRQSPLVVGSVKSNIGHLESAAGVAALTKVLLQMKHKAIAPSLHSENLNRNIDFQSAEVVVNQTLRTWDPDAGSSQLCAGISSFGAGGSNAHLIIGSYDNVDKCPVTEYPVFQRAVALSAKSPERLIRYAARLSDYIKENSEDKLLSIGNIAYSLLTGREHFPHRLFVIANDVADLLHHLDTFAAGEGVDNVFRFQASNSSSNYSEFVTTFGVQAQFLNTINVSIAEGDFHGLARFWCDGLDIPWCETAVVNWGRKIPLPGYPFECEHYDIPEAAKLTAAHAKAEANFHFPMSSTQIAAQKPEGAVLSTLGFSRRESVLTDHIVNNDPILSGAAILCEIQDYAKLEFGNRAIQIKNILFSQPIYYREKDGLYIYLVGP